MDEPALYKFLDAAGSCPVSGQAWPQPRSHSPGAWLERHGEFDPEGLGFLVFRAQDLAPWASSQLYRVDVADHTREEAGVICASRVRLAGPVLAWPEIARELIQLERERASALAVRHARLAEYAQDVASCVEYGMINGVLFITALMHARAADPEACDAVARRDAFLSERGLQSRFIAERLAAAV